MFLCLTTRCPTQHGLASSTATIGTSPHLFIFPKSPFNACANSSFELMRNFLSPGLDLTLSFQQTGFGKPQRPDL
jgi:hypothetical protein